MKLRNKNTGEAVYVDFQIPLCNNDETLGSYSVTSLEALNRSFDDYKPKEPLIKDEKIRKAVRAWADANETSQVQFDSYTSGFSASDAGHNLLSMISFDGFVFNCVDGKLYNIDELCGEEKE